MLVPARDVRSLPIRLASLVAARLGKLDIEVRAIDAERSAMATVEIGPTADRSVLGIMVDFAKALPLYLDPGRWNESTLQLVEDRLAETPCHAGRTFERVIFPKKKTLELLRMKWLSDSTLLPAAENRNG
jgi:hypothetical protein